MKKYELVIVIDANLSSSAISDVQASVEKLIDGSILDTDQIWLVPVAYPLLGQDQAFFVSYYVNLDSQVLPELKSELRLIKWLAKFVFYTMHDEDAFLKMADLEKRYLDSLPEELVQEEEDVVEVQE